MLGPWLRERLLVITLKCFLPAWIAAWVVAVFLPSILIAYLGLSAPAAAIGTGWERLPATGWKVADDVGPAVKLMIGGLLLGAFLGLERGAGLSTRLRYALAIASGLAAVVLTIALVPAGYTRGFALALTGARFDATTTPLYLLGGIVAGITFVASADRCKRVGRDRA
ncbi:hypothetical protein AB2M62_15060 [Sphingomonas sp. MMS12-HWE2-04]|uniref:hypothetical protein n=1 Tax=Sphingomonas sp. MMS12-HWE2-04 TaxID=3234199 RepID=UPI00384CCA54